MPKNKGKGGKGFKKGKNESEQKRELVFKEDGQEYAKIIKIMGGGVMEAFCFDDVVRKCHIRGHLGKKTWISVGDIVLINVREYQNKVGDIIHKFEPCEVVNLKNYGEIPDNVVIDKQQEDKDTDIVFDFDENNTDDI